MATAVRGMAACRKWVRAGAKRRVVGVGGRETRRSAIAATSMANTVQGLVRMVREEGSWRYQSDKLTTVWE